MSHPIIHPSSDGIIDRLAQVFRSGKAYRSQSHWLLFVCGGPTGPDDDSLRKRFIEFAGDELPEFRVFLSETAAKDLTRSRQPKFVNLAIFEKLLATVADCVVLFVESPGSQAELGYFSNAEGAIDNLLVVNDLCFQTRESFINNGPIHLINGRSNFSPAIHLDSANLPIEFNRIKERLGRFEKRYRERFLLVTIDELNHQDRLFLILEIIKLFCVIDVHGILHVLQRWCGECDEEEVRRLISILLATKYVRRLKSDTRSLTVSTGVKTFLDLEKFSFGEFRLELAQHYKYLNPDVYGLLEEAST